jgi:hypothetical protein
MGFCLGVYSPCETFTTSTNARPTNPTIELELETRPHAIVCLATTTTTT